MTHASAYILATLDTKGEEARFVCDQLRAHDVPVRLVDVGCQGEPRCHADVSRDQVFAAANAALDEVRAVGDRGQAIALAAQGAARLVAQAYAQGELAGLIALGGSAGTTIGTAAMQVLPLGVPKVMVSTLASGDVHSFVRSKDIAMFHSVVDIAGLNRVSRPILANAAAALAGMIRRPTLDGAADRPLLAATMFGVTTPCVLEAKTHLEDAGFEVLVFHATGSGGKAMEALIREGVIAGVLDITTTELADELVGGILSAGPNRLTAAAECGVPQVVSVGALDMVNFGPRDSVPNRFRERWFHVHNAHVTLMRTTVEENRLLGEELGRKVAASRAAATILFPQHGVSAIDRAGQPFDDPAAREALYRAIASTCGATELVALPLHINDPAFARAAAEKLLALVRKPTQRDSHIHR